MKNKKMRILLILGFVFTMLTTGAYGQDNSKIDILELSGGETQTYEVYEVEGPSRYKNARKSEDIVYERIKRGLEDLEDEIIIDDLGLSMDEYEPPLLS